MQTLLLALVASLPIRRHRPSRVGYVLPCRDVACLAELWEGRACLMEAALWYHTDVVGMLLSRRDGHPT